MRRLALACWIACALCLPAVAAEPVMMLDGEAYHLQARAKPAHGDKLLEFIRPTETPDNWTRLIGLRLQHVPSPDNDPQKFAAVIAHLVKRINPEAQTKLVLNEKTGEAVVDFLTWPPDGEYIEFNVWRCTKSRDGEAVVSLQYAYRFTDQSPAQVERFTTLRSEWIRQAVTFDMRIAHDALAGE